MARNRYGEARPLYHQIGSLLGEANCIQSLGHIAWALSEYDEARNRFNEALSLFRQLGVVLGEANCTVGLGDLALHGAQPAQARALYEEALELYTQIPEAYSMGKTNRRLARIARDIAEQALHVAAAHRCWTSIDRPHLVAELDAEFPPIP